MCNPIRMDLICVSFKGMESLEKVITFSILTGKAQMLDTEKKVCQKEGQQQVCLMLSLKLPQPKRHPLFLAPNLDLVHQWLEIVRIWVKVSEKDLLEAKE